MHPPGARFVLERDENGSTVRVFGDVDLATVEEFESTLSQAASDDGPVVVDLLECKYIDSKGLFALTRWKAQLDTRLSVDIPAEGPIKRIFEISGMLGRLGVKTR